MKYLLFCASILVSTLINAEPSAVTTPVTPCYVDGVFQGTIEITHCWAKGGNVDNK